MSISQEQLLRYVVDPALSTVGVGGRDAVTLIMVTGHIESKFKYIHQLNNGPAKGFWQMEPTTHIDLWVNYLRYHPKLASQIAAYTGIHPSKENHQALIWNLAYSCLMARMAYYRQDFVLPPYLDADTQWEIYKQFYNSRLGASKYTQFINSHQRILPLIENLYPI